MIAYYIIIIYKMEDFLVKNIEIFDGICPDFVGEELTPPVITKN